MAWCTATSRKKANLHDVKPFQQVNIGRFCFLCLILWGSVLHFGLIAITYYNRSFLLDDSVLYLTSAHNLLTYHVFSSSFSLPLYPELQRLPGHAVFLALLGGKPLIILIAQHILCALSALLIFQLVQKLLESRGKQKQWGKFAGALWWAAPYPALMATLVLTETLLAFLMLTTLFLLVKSDSTKPSRRIALYFSTCLFLCLAWLVKSKALLLLPLIWAVWLLIHRQSISKNILWIACSLVFAFAIPQFINTTLFSVPEYNSQSNLSAQTAIYGQWGGVLQIENKTLPCSDAVLFAQTDYFWNKAYGSSPEANFTFGREQQEYALWKKSDQQIALQSMILKHPISTLKLAGWSLYRQFASVGYGTAWYLTDSPFISKILAGVQMIFNLCFGVCMICWPVIAFRFLRKKSLIRSIFTTKEAKAYIFTTIIWCCVILYLLAHTVVWADGRYRFPVDAMLLIVTVACLASMKSIVK